jgi:phosphotransacetylase
MRNARSRERSPVTDDKPMPTRSFRNTPFEQIRIGEPMSVTRLITEAEVQALALVSGEVRPHELVGYTSLANKAAAQAVGAEAIVSGLLNRRLPGPGTRIVSQQLQFQGTIQSGGEVTATVTATQKNDQDHSVRFDCSVSQNGVDLVRGHVTVIAPTETIAYDDLATPELILRQTDQLANLLAHCANLPAVPCAVVHPCDRDSLLGALEAARRGLIEPILVGPPAKIRAVAKSEGVDLSTWRVVETEHSHAAAQAAVELARSGEVQGLMKGSLHTDELMGAVVAGDSGLRTARRISHVFVLDVPSYPRPLLLTDAAINIAPGLEAKVDIVQNAIDLAHVLGIAEPRVALLSAVETVTSKIQSSIDAAALCKMADRGQITGGLLDGPLAFDNAINEAAARTKGITSTVAGRADILLVPDLEAGNMLAKQLQYLAGADSAGIVLGTRVPIVLTSRADTVRTRMASAAVMVLLAHARRSVAA